MEMNYSDIYDFMEWLKATPKRSNLSKRVKKRCLLRHKNRVLYKVSVRRRKGISYLHFYN